MTVSEDPFCQVEKSVEVFVRTVLDDARLHLFSFARGVFSPPKSGHPSSTPQIEQKLLKGGTPSFSQGGHRAKRSQGVVPSPPGVGGRPKLGPPERAAKAGGARFSRPRSLWCLCCLVEVRASRRVASRSCWRYSRAMTYSVLACAAIAVHGGLMCLTVENAHRMCMKPYVYVYGICICRLHNAGTVFGIQVHLLLSRRSPSRTTAFSPGREMPGGGWRTADPRNLCMRQLARFPLVKDVPTDPCFKATAACRAKVPVLTAMS